MAVIEKNLGPVSAYAVAVANGYEGTEEQWAAEIAAASQNAQAAAGSATEAAGSAAAAAQSVTDANAAKTAAQQAAESASAAYGTDLLAATFAADAPYVSGQYVIYNGGLYVFTADHPAGAWIGTDAQSVQVGGELTDLKSAMNGLDETLISEGTIKKKFNAINVYPGSTITSSGIITTGPSGSDKNIYVYNVPENTKILATGGSPYGLFATNPVKNTTQSVDQTRHLGTLNNTEITMPTGANYIAIVHTAESVVIKDTKTTSEIVEELTSEVGDINEFINVDIAFTFSGFIRYDGALINNADYKTTDFVPVTNNGTYIPLNYKVKVINATQFAFYDGQKQFIKAVEVTTSSALTEVTGVLPYVSGAVYVRLCSYSNNYTDYFAKYSTIKNVVTGIIPYPTDFQGSEISVFNKILCIGDSLTSGTFNYRVGSSTGNYIEDAKYSYPAYLKSLTGSDTTNMGNGGKTSLEWYQMHANDDLSGYDCAIIQLGINDVGRYSTWGQDSIDGFSGIINKLKTENKNIKIFVANIIPARSYHTEAYLNMSAAISAFITGLNDPQVILLNMQQYGHTYDSAAYNCGHLSALGYWRLAQDYKSYISWHIFMNKTDFKEVQFIGTDYYYDPIN